MGFGASPAKFAREVVSLGGRGVLKGITAGILDRVKLLGM